MGPMCHNHERNGSQSRRPQGNHRRMERLNFSFSYPQSHLELLSGFILWKIWKERNRKIFHSSHLDWQIVWKHIHDNIRETIHLQPWKEEDLSCPPSRKVYPGQLEHQLQPSSFQETSEILGQRQPFILVPSNSRIYQVKL
jgi:hypothetical protein